MAKERRFSAKRTFTAVSPSASDSDGGGSDTDSIKSARNKSLRTCKDRMKRVDEEIRRLLVKKRRLQRIIEVKKGGERDRKRKMARTRR